MNLNDLTLAHLRPSAEPTTLDDFFSARKMRCVACHVSEWRDLRAEWWAVSTIRPNVQERALTIDCESANGSPNMATLIADLGALGVKVLSAVERAESHVGPLVSMFDPHAFELQDGIIRSAVRIECIEFRPKENA